MTARDAEGVGTINRRVMRAIRVALRGRQMDREGLAFRDVVSGRPVYYFVDAFGRRWMAEHRWARFRVRATYGSAKEPR